MKYFTSLLLLGLFIFATTTCVSVKLGDQSFKASKRYSYSGPGSAFKYLKDDSYDVAWLHKKTGTTISVRSKCKKGLDIDLESWMNDLAMSLGHTEPIEYTQIRFNKRKALQSFMNTSIEGYKNRLAITTFVKNSCHYILAMTALSSDFDKDLKYYNSFLQDFKAW